MILAARWLSQLCKLCRQREFWTWWSRKGSRNWWKMTRSRSANRTSWVLCTESCPRQLSKCYVECWGQSGDSKRIEVATQWMDTMNKRIHEVLPADYIMSRWHIEIDGDHHGRYLSTMSLISYFQFTLTQHTDLNQILEFISKRLQLILIRSNRIIKIAENSLMIIAAWSRKNKSLIQAFIFSYVYSFWGAFYAYA